MRAPIALALAFLGAALPAAAETIHIEYTEVPYRAPYAFLNLHFDALGPVTATQGAFSVKAPLFGFGLTLMSVRDSNLQFLIELGYRHFDTSRLKIQGAESFGAFDLMLGGRFYPRKPPLAFGPLVLRPTVSLSAGGGLVGTAANALVVLTGGFAFGLDDDPNALLLEFVYRPLSEDAGYALPGLTTDEGRVALGSSWSIRFSFLFGP